MTAITQELGMPKGEGDLTIEGHGMEPIPDSARYGSVGRIFTVWFTPNLVPAAFFLGTLAAASFIGLGFWTALAAIVVGNVVGSVLVGLLATMGPKTGMAQMRHEGKIHQLGNSSAPTIDNNPDRFGSGSIAKYIRALCSDCQHLSA
jgi:purine-cytosine permease-like protein